ncbi:MAG: hypothetical protein IH963_01910 [Chloroflexi bacterium]|nr:hypothetical protein [Chloroflexota bacterium]
MATGLNSVARKVFKLFEGSGELWTRETARGIRETIEGDLITMPVGSLLEIDASGIEVFDYSFASELFAKLVMRLPIEFEGRCIAVTGLNPYPEENLDPALANSGVMMRVIEEKNHWHLIGKFSGVDRETLNALSLGEQPMSASGLAKILDINVTASNERLARLTRFGLLHRIPAGSGRVQFQYSFPL